MDGIYRLHAEVCKTLASPVRLKIINTLRTRKMGAGKLLEEVKINKVILSQHMSILVDKGVVKSERAGKNVFYMLSDPQIIKACDIMRKVLIKNIKRNNEILKKYK
ncbi:MAG: hypothetical protein A3J83_09195 [Elusimicrobia bacterium RIFOXYA2_FULL_40_6]|nr:MAG: hypothetical protein A3J83_09195 [Elusimicrobia bacterium RIFOXYA2_FULL_40_6]